MPPTHTASSWKETLDALPSLAFALRLDGSIEVVNRAFSIYTGLSDETSRERRWQSVAHPDDLADTEQSIAEGIAAGAVFHVKHRLRSRAGIYRSYDSIASPYRDASGIRLWLGIATDVDDQARTLALLADSEHRLQAFLDSVPLIVWTADPTGWLDGYNRRWYQFTGQTREEAAGWGWQAAHHPDDFVEVMRKWPHSIATGEPFEMEFRLRRHDGAFRWMLTRVVPSRDENGTIVRWYGSNTEIHDQKVSQQRSVRVAEVLQDALLPTTLPQGDGFCFDAVYKPAASDGRIGGDWYDATYLDGGRIFISIGDVTGHGIEAASLAGQLRLSLAFAGMEDANPARVLARVNSFMIARDLPVATAAVAIFDPKAMTLTYALAGHPPPVIATADGAATIATCGGLPLGVRADLRAANQVVTLAPDSVVAFYTDGITEQSRDILAAEQALCEAAGRIAANADATRPAERLRDAALAGAFPSDDTAVIVLQMRAEMDHRTARGFVSQKTWRFHSSHSLSARNARIELADYMRSIAIDPNSVYEAELIIGEILANTVEHSPGVVEIDIDWSGEMPHIRVRDRGSGWPHIAAAWPSDPMSEGGRGIPLIAAFASDVVIGRTPEGGAFIACTLPVKRAWRRHADKIATGEPPSAIDRQ